MPSAQVATMAAPSGNVCGRETSPPSALGRFFSRLSATKTHSKSPTVTLSLKCKMNTLPSTDATQTELLKEDQKRALILAEKNITDVGLTRAPPEKPKRTSSPFARVMNRLSMSRKHSNSFSNERIEDVDREALNTKVTLSPLSTAVSPNCATSPRPAISESDLRHITLHRGQVLASEITPLSGAIPFRSEDNLVGSNVRPPSYLRVSCALNGYRQYRRLQLNDTPLRAPTGALPLSNVERRTLLFSSPEFQGGTSPGVSQKAQLIGEMNGTIKTPTPVRQLVARFDNLHLSSGERSSSEKENRSIHLTDENTHLTEQCDALHHSATPRSSLPLSSQVPNKVLSNSVPEPILAQPMHSILQRTTVIESKPHQDNQSEVIVNDRKPEKAEMAKRILSDYKTTTELLTVEDYRKLLHETRATLENRAAEAISILDKQENELPEYAAGALRSAAGNANLLLKKKLPRFAELLQKNLNPVEGDTQLATLDDLAGYWALVSMELDDVERLFAEVDELRKNDWQKATTSADESPIQLPPHSGSKSLAAKPSVGNKTVKTGGAIAGGQAAKNEVMKAAEAKRRKELAEAIRKQKERMLKQKNASDGSTQCAEQFIC